MVAEVLQTHVRHLLMGRGVEEDVERHELVGAALEPDAAGHPVLLAAVAGGPQVEVVADHAVREADVGAGGAELLCPAGHVVVHDDGVDAVLLPPHLPHRDGLRPVAAALGVVKVQHRQAAARLLAEICPEVEGC